MDKALIVNRAAGILRKIMSDIIDSPDTYISAAKIEVAHCRSEVPDALYDFIVRLGSTSARRDYQNVTTTSEADVPDLRVLEICYNIIALCKNGPTLMLGLALLIHHNVGSMHLMHPLPKTRSHRLEMSMYHKVYRVWTLWGKPESLTGEVTMRLGGMHTLMAFTASIGKLFEDGSLL